MLNCRTSNQHVRRSNIFQIMAKAFKRNVAKIYLDSSACHVDKLRLYYLLHPVVQKHDVTLCSNQPFPWVPSLSFTLPHHFLTFFWSLLRLKCTYNLFIYHSHSHLGQPIKKTYSNEAGPNYLVNCYF